MQKEPTEGFDPNLLTPEPRRPAPLSVEEREALAKPAEPQNLYLDEKDVPQHMRANNPPPKDTTPEGTRSVNENAAAYQKILEQKAAERAAEAIAEAKSPKHLQVFDRLKAEREKMEVKSHGEGATTQEAS